MNRSVFVSLTVVVLLAGVWLFFHQRGQVAAGRVALAAARASTESQTMAARATDAPSSAADSPSSELLRLRAEVTQLRQDLDSLPSRSPLPTSGTEDWALVHSGPKPSQQRGFQYFTNLTHAGFSTPEAAFQSFYFAMRNQHNEALTPSRMKEIWDVPDDFDDPNAKYSINLGSGMGSEFGYRIVTQESISTNAICLVVEYEKPDGSSFRREQVLVQTNGRWRVKPAGVTLAEPQTKR